MARRKSKGARQSTMNRRRKGALAVILPWLKRFGLIVLATVGLGWVGSWLWLSGAFGKAGDYIENKTVEFAGDMGFSVRNVMVEGRVYTDPDLLRAMINTQEGDPLFAFNPSEAKAMIEKIRWVKSARVERRLPDTIYVGLQERKPLALYQADKKLTLIDEDGEDITSEGLARFGDLIIVMGEGAPGQAAELVRTVRAEPALQQRIKAAKWVGLRRWDIEFDNGVEAKLPERDMGFALRRLAQAQEEDAILDKEIVGIDLREPARMIVRTKPGAVQEYRQRQEAAYKPGDDI